MGMLDEVFVGREEYLSKATEFLQGLISSEISKTPRFVVLTGPGGIGKTKLANKIGLSISEKGIIATPLIDLKATQSRSELLLLNSIASCFEGNAFHHFFSSLNDYDSASDLDRNKYHKAAVESFLRCYQALSEKSPIILILDTFEAVQDTRLEAWLLILLKYLSGRCGVVLAGRNAITLKEVQVLELSLEPFSQHEVEILAKLLYGTRHAEYDLDNHVLYQIHRLANGRPILVTLAIEWILENAEPEKITNLPNAQFEREIVSHIRLLKKQQESQAILLMSIANRRFNIPIMSLLTGFSAEECKYTCTKLARFSFVKVRIGEPIFTLHDEMLRLITEYIDLPRAYKDNLRRILVEGYYDEVLSEAVDPQTQRTLIAEKIYYQLYYDPKKGIETFESEMRRAIESYDFELCNLILSETKQHQIDDHLQDIVELNRAEMLLKKYLPNDAKPIFDYLVNRFDPNFQPEYHSRVLEGLGGCIINPCTIVEANIFDAIGFWENSLSLCQKHSLNNHLATILFQLGNTYVYIGQHDDAEKCYSKGLGLAREQNDLKLVARILDEMGKMYRLQQNVQKAFPPLKESLEIRQSINDYKNMGISYYYLGNAYRDLDDFDTAAKYYKMAESALLEIGDEFKLCELYNDVSWVARLKSDFDSAIEYLEKSREIVMRRNFGTEISEYYHIAYEVAMARDAFEAAYSNLDKALYYGRRYSNIYMILDCLNHDAQRAYAKREHERIPTILQEMADFEARGCGTKVFRGRAMMVYGDVHYDRGDFEQALTLWTEGLIIVALYGNSRTNSELFSDIVEQRRAKLIKVLLNLGPQAIKDISNRWSREGLEPDFPVIVEICNHARSSLS